jgi:hypothetical protein
LFAEQNCIIYVNLQAKKPVSKKNAYKKNILCRPKKSIQVLIEQK